MGPLGVMFFQDKTEPDYGQQHFHTLDGLLSNYYRQDMGVHIDDMVAMNKVFEDLPSHVKKGYLEKLQRDRPQFTAVPQTKRELASMADLARISSQGAREALDLMRGGGSIAADDPVSSVGGRNDPFAAARSL